MVAICWACGLAKNTVLITSHRQCRWILTTASERDTVSHIWQRRLWAWSNLFSGHLDKRLDQDLNFLELGAACTKGLAGAGVSGKREISPDPWSFFLKLINLFILAALGLCCCAWAFSSCGERGLLFVVVRGLLVAVVSLVAEHRL